MGRRGTGSARHGRPRALATWILLFSLTGVAGSACGQEPELEILSRALVDGIEQAYCAYPSADLTVTGWLFINPFSEEDVEPALIFAHGGVGGVNEATRALCRRMAREGFVVFAPSYRGEDDSEGEIEVGVGEVDDLIAAVEQLRLHPGVRSDRFVLFGTSHGALVCVKAAARPEMRPVLRGVVAAYGVMDVYAWYQHLLDHDFDVSDSLSRRIYGEGPEDRPEAFAARHALNVLDDLAPAPIFIVQGERDPIVPVAQARTLYAALRARGRTQDRLEIYPLGAHGFLYWDDAALHGPAELDEAERAWHDIFEFLHACVRDGTDD